MFKSACAWKLKACEWAFFYAQKRVYGTNWRSIFMSEEATEQEVKQTEEQQPFKSFATRAELDSYTDKRISKALDTAKEKWASELDDMLKEREDKAKKLASMTAKDRAEAELKDRQKALDEREHELNMKAYRIEAQKQLEENKLPADLVDLVLTDNAENTHANIQLLSETVDELVKARVAELSNTSSPKDSAGFKSSDQANGDVAAFAQKNRLI